MHFFKIMHLSLDFENNVLYNQMRGGKIMEAKLPFCNEQYKKINLLNIISELVEATKYISIFETKIDDNKSDSYLFLPKMQVQEAAASLKIEGTSTKIEDYYVEQSAPTENKHDDISNHLKALETGMACMVSGFSNELIKKIHASLFENSNTIKPGTLIGDFKRKNNFIGRENIKIYQPPSVEETKIYMDDLIKFINQIDNINPLVKCAIVHAQFESIHPFEDGNGRVGRILIPIYLYYAGFFKAPLLYISEAIEADKGSYYNCLQKTREDDYDSWIKFFLSKCVVQSKKHIELIEKINFLYDSTKAQIMNITNSSISEKIVKAIFKNPILNTKKFADEISVSPSQANRYLKTLEQNNILRSNSKKRNTSYFFTELLYIIC